MLQTLLALLRLEEQYRRMGEGPKAVELLRQSHVMLASGEVEL